MKMNIEIRRLVPDLAEDYVRFFDKTPHADNRDDHRCYCVWWCNDDAEGKDYSSVEKRRDYAVRYVKGNNIQGYLAYCDGEVVGWCNANTKSDCLNCYCWRRFMGAVPIEQSTPDYAIAPRMQRKGIATQLLERVCSDAKQDGFDFVEAYPNRAFVDEAEDFMGPVELYTKSGFVLWHETEQKLVMRKSLSEQPLPAFTVRLPVQ
jgi:GNAT superfamily N-acetyltransferase